MAKLAVIAEAYDVDSQEAMHRLIDGFYSSPHTGVGQDVQKVMAAGSAAQTANAMSSNPLFQMFSTLPPEIQQQLIQRLVGGLLGQKESPTGF